MYAWVFFLITSIFNLVCFQKFLSTHTIKWTHGQPKNYTTHTFAKMCSLCSKNVIMLILTRVLKKNWFENVNGLGLKKYSTKNWRKIYYLLFFVCDLYKQRSNISEIFFSNFEGLFRIYKHYFGPSCKKLWIIFTFAQPTF